MTATRVTLLLTVCVAVLLGGCASNPATGEATVALMSEEKEVELGKQLHPRIIAQYGVYPDSELQGYVNDIGQRLAAVSERPDLVWSFTVLNDDTINAFALPGGYVYITRGIMAHLRSEAELAAVIGHEIGHVTARHAATRDRNQKLAGVASTLTAIATRSVAGAQAASLAGDALVSGFGRTQELEADELGARYIAKAGYPTEAVFTAVEILKRREQFEIERARAEGRQPRIPKGIFNTHPDNDVRFEEAIEAASQYQSDANADPRVEEYLNRINGMAFGPKNIPGVVRNNYYYHSRFGIKMKFPEDWRVMGSTGQIQAISPENDAAMQVFVVVPGRNMTPMDVIQRKLGLSQLKEAREITVSGLPAVIGIGDRYGQGPFGNRPVRAAAIVDQRRRKAYVFAGTGKNDLSRIARDDDFIPTIFTFDHMERSEINLGRPPVIRIVRAEDDTTIEGLAESSAVPVFAEQQLRLINGLYPAGEPQPGQLLKTVD
ncbi:MAG: M48 family metalloprotease [Pseudomonadota bacterium]